MAPIWSHSRQNPVWKRRTFLTSWWSSNDVCASMKSTRTPSGGGSLLPPCPPRSPATRPSRLRVIPSQRRHWAKRWQRLIWNILATMFPPLSQHPAWFMGLVSPPSAASLLGLKGLVAEWCQLNSACLCSWLFQRRPLAHLTSTFPAKITLSAWLFFLFFVFLQPEATAVARLRMK